MQVSSDVRDLNPHLSDREIKAARVKKKKEGVDYEQRLYAQISDAGLPLPLRSKGNRGPMFAKVLGIGYVADFLWVEERVIVEVNGQIWRKGGHTTGNGLRRDFYKQSLAQLLGYRYFEVDTQMVQDGTALLIIQCALGVRETFEQNWKEMQP